MNRASITGFIKELVSFAILAAIIVVPIRLFIAQPFIVNGESMYPTFDTNDYLIVDQITYRFNEPKRGDVVIFRYPENPSKFFIKRIIGLPGETVQISNGIVTIVGTDGASETLDEPYVKFPRETTETTALTPDEYFVMGDNRLASLDSRSWGPLPEKLMIGRALVRLLPIQQIELFPGAIN